MKKKIKKRVNGKTVVVGEKYEYDRKEARKRYYKHNNLRGGLEVKCPVCQKFVEAYLMDLHHMLPKNIGKHLWYDPKYMILLCHACHENVHLAFTEYTANPH